MTRQRGNEATRQQSAVRPGPATAPAGAAALVNELCERWIEAARKNGSCWTLFTIPAEAWPASIGEICGYLCSRLVHFEIHHEDGRKHLRIHGRNLR